jgi:hypothetical protein
VFRTISEPPSSWESSLPPELLRLPQELARVDALLDDAAFFAPYFHPVLGPLSTPVECYLRLMFLKFRYQVIGVGDRDGSGMARQRRSPQRCAGVAPAAAPNAGSQRD